MLHAVSLAFALSILWLLLSGYFTEPLLLALGLASVLLVLVIVHRMEVLDPEGHPVHLGPRALLNAAPRGAPSKGAGGGRAAAHFTRVRRRGIE